jgi:ribonuclease P protein component
VRSRDVQRVFDQGRKVHGTRVVVFLAPGTGQFAVVAGRRVGGAVERNRARRILRTAWRAVAAPSGYDAVLVAREAVRGARSQELMNEMSSLLRREGVTP